MIDYNLVKMSLIEIVRVWVWGNYVRFWNRNKSGKEEESFY